jgi:hypothetical protein
MFVAVQTYTVTLKILECQRQFAALLGAAKATSVIPFLKRL